MSRVLVILCILSFSQLPVFVDQYRIRLQGHLAESQRQVEAFQTAATTGGKSLDQYIAKFLEQADADFKHQGTLMQGAMERNQFLQNACNALQDANPFLRPVVFIRYLDNQILAEAWRSFTPGLSLSVHVAVWALVGCAFGWCLVLALRGIFGSGK